ncbi:MAG: hypothetical protein ABR521_03540 [Gaiellaceae bacterium]
MVARVRIPLGANRPFSAAPRRSAGGSIASPVSQDYAQAVPRLCAAAAAGFVGLALLGAAAAETRKLPPYVTENGGNFRVNANAHWGRVRQFVPDTRFPDTIAAIWPKTCPHGEQTATFSRTITIPGPPGDVTFQLNALFGSFPNPIDWAEVKVNGRLLLHRRLTATNFTATLDEKKVRQAFRFGDNEIDIRVHRRALPPPMKRCNAGGKDFLHDPTRLAVQFALYGAFVADLGFDPKPKAVYQKVPGGAQAITAAGTLTFANKGPSGLANGRLTLRVTAELLVVRNVSDCKGGPGVTEPTRNTFHNPKGEISIGCDVPNLPPRGRRTLSVQVGRKANVTTDFSELRMYQSWALYGGGPADPDITDNQGTIELVFCGKLSTLEGCKTAK